MADITSISRTQRSFVLLLKYLYNVVIWTKKYLELYVKDSFYLMSGQNGAVSSLSYKNCPETVSKQEPIYRTALDQHRKMCLGIRPLPL